MDETYLYKQISESIQDRILSGELKPGDRLPSVRQMCDEWKCTPGTVQRAYNELARRGLLTSRAGKGTMVSGTASAEDVRERASLRRASLVHRSEGFVLEALTAGHTLPEIQQALELALDRWRVQGVERPPAETTIIRFAGSHDMAVNALAARLFEIAPDAVLQVSTTGSLGGLMALAEGRADLAGCHLWDAESDLYNVPFVRRLLPGKEALLVTLAHRRLGLIVPAGNPLGLRQVADLARPGVRFINRQSGSGTRVWLDAVLSRQLISSSAIQGYGDERSTHSEVARAVAEGTADVGLGLETAAVAYGLDFVFLARERYDLVTLAETAEQAPLSLLLDWLGTPPAKGFIAGFAGYDNRETGTRISLH
jgi:molybdate-binding protein/DNA-binding transcriptional regulator YhcF (GntR family)